MPKLQGFIATSIVALLVTAGCSAGSGTANPPEQEAKQLTVGLIAEPASLDFTRNDGAAIPQALLVNVYEGLVKLDANGEIVPLLAKSYTVSEDRRTYTFKLQEGAKFSNDAPFTAEDAAFSINRVKTDWTTSLKAGMDVVDTAVATNPTTLQVTLEQPSNSWLFRMTTRIGAMFSRTGINDLATKPVGTGPYTVKSWKRGDVMTLAANPDYWGTKPPTETVSLKYFKDPTAMNNALITGSIDVVSSVQAPDSLDQFKDTSKFQIIEGTTNGEVVMSFNDGKKPFTDKRVRQAICYAIDRQAVIDTAWAGHGQLIGSMVAPTDPWYEDLSKLYPHDPEKAKTLLAQAGTPKLTLRFRIPNLPYAVSAAQVVKSQLADVGITAQIDVLEFPARWLSEVFTNADYDMSIIAHVEPRDIASWANPKYYWRYDNKQVQKLLAEADSGTEQEQVAKTKQAARLLAEDAAADWLFLFPNLIAAKVGVKGLPKNVISEAFDLTTVSKG